MLSTRTLLLCTSSLKKSFTEQPARPDEAQAHAHAHEDAQAHDDAHDEAHEDAQDERCEDPPLLFLDEPPEDLLEELLTGTLM